MKKHLNQMIMGLALGFGVIVATALLSDVNELVKQAIAFPWWIMIPVLGLRVLNWALRLIKWHFYLHVVGVQNLTIRENAIVFVAGFPLALSPGKMAEVLRSLFVKNLFGAPVAMTLPVVFAERISDGVAVLVLLAVSIVALAAVAYWPLALICLLIFGVGIAVLQNRKLSLRLLDRAVRLPLISRLAEPLRAFYESSYELVRWRSIVVAFGLGLGANLLDVVGVYLILLGLGLPPTPDVFFQALLIISLSVTVGAVSALPGGLGAADLSIGVIMQTVVGLSVSMAGFATLLVRFAQLWWGVLVGMVVGYVFRDLFLPQGIGAVDLVAQTDEISAKVAEGISAR